eukprot:s4615_g6.t1
MFRASAPNFEGALYSGASEGRMKVGCSLEAVLDVPQVACSAAVASCGRAAQWEVALRMLATLQCRKMKIATPSCNAAISACERSYRWPLSLALFKQLREASDADLISWNSTLSALEKGSQWHRCLTLFSEMRAQADIVACNAAVTACMRGEAWEQALALLKAAEQQHLPLSKVTFNATIAAVSRGTRWEERTKYDMLQLSSLVTETTSESVAGVSAAGSNHERHGTWYNPGFLLRKLT